MKYTLSCHQLGDDMFLSQRVEKICSIIQIINKTNMARFIMILVLRGFEVKESDEIVILVQRVHFSR